MNFLKKEMLLLDSSPEPSTPYRTILTATLYECALSFPDVAGTVVRILLNYIGRDVTLPLNAYLYSIFGRR